MPKPYVITEKQTAAIGFQLMEGGSPLNLTGATVAILMTDNTGTVIATGAVSVTDATNGKVAWTPATTADLVASKSPYQVRWKITDGSGKIKYVPSGLRDVWEITQE
jgi:hypothetical protein